MSEELKDALEIEVVDDTPEADQGKARTEPPTDSPEPPEDEIATYSQRVKDRINRLKYEYHEERRQKEAALRTQEEAIRYAQQLLEENRKMQGRMHQGEKVLVSSMKSKAETLLEKAKADLKKAHEDGDADAMVKAQENLNRATYEAMRVAEYTPQEQAPPDKAEVPVPTVEPKKLDEKTQSWLERNPWFQENQKMAAYAMAIHADLIKRGVSPASDEYFRLIDEEMHEQFSNFFSKQQPKEKTPEEPAPRKQTPTVVAPVRPASGTPRKVQLTASQVALAARLGLKPEQYAAQLMKERDNAQL